MEGKVESRRERRRGRVDDGSMGKELKEREKERRKETGGMERRSGGKRKEKENWCLIEAQRG